MTKKDETQFTTHTVFRTLDAEPGSATGLSETELMFDFVAAIMLLDDDVFRMQGFNELVLLPLVLILRLVWVFWGR